MKKFWILILSAVLVLPVTPLHLKASQSSQDSAERNTPILVSTPPFSQEAEDPLLAVSPTAPSPSNEKRHSSSFESIVNRGIKTLEIYLSYHQRYLEMPYLPETEKQSTLKNLMVAMQKDLDDAASIKDESPFTQQRKSYLLCLLHQITDAPALRNTIEKEPGSLSSVIEALSE